MRGGETRRKTGRERDIEAIGHFTLSPAHAAERRCPTKWQLHCQDEDKASHSICQCHCTIVRIKSGSGLARPGRAKLTTNENMIRSMLIDSKCMNVQCHVDCGSDVVVLLQPGSDRKFGSVRFGSVVRCFFGGSVRFGSEEILTEPPNFLFKKWPEIELFQPSFFN